jgi:alpha-1,2-mannosyltransferase
MTGVLASLAASARGGRWPRPTRIRLLAATAWIVALAAIGHLVATAVDGQMLDLDVYRTGGQAILHGGNLYAIHAADNLPFTYPPVSAILSVPLALVPFQVAKLGWIVFVYGPLVFAVRAGFWPLLGRVAGAAPIVFPLILAAGAYLLPLRQDIGFGQVDMLLLGLCLLDCLATSPRWPQGVLIGLAAAIKLEPGVFIVYLLITGRRRAAGVAALSFAGLTVLAWLINPRDSVAYWTSAIFDTSRLGGNASAGNQALRGVVLRLHLAVATDLVWLPLALIVGAGGFAAARACWQHGHDLAGITITGLLGALLSPVAWIHHLCWVLVAVGVIAGDGRKANRIGPAALTVLLFLSTLPTWAEVTLSAAQLRSLPGFVAENSFSLWALGLIPVLCWIGISTTAPASGSAAAVGEADDADAAPPLPAQKTRDIEHRPAEDISPDRSAAP